MTDRVVAEDWFRRYRIAWETNDTDDIRGLFTDDAEYFYRPADPEPAIGIDAIVASWLDNKDEPGDTEFEWKVLAVDGEIAIAQCVTRYVNTIPPRIYDNLFVTRLLPDGRAKEFTEWYIQRTTEE